MSDEPPRRLPVRVCKVGGSLFDLPDLRERLERWIAAQSPAVNVLLAGGGEMVDCIRRSHARKQLNEQSAHWLSIEVLQVTAIWLSEIYEDSVVVFDTADAVLNSRRASDSTVRVFSPKIFLDREEPEVPGERLPESWSVTSDSIAARVAAALQADELVLLKSRVAPLNESLASLAQTGFVDAFFPRAAAPLKHVRFVNLRG